MIELTDGESQHDIGSAAVPIIRAPPWRCWPSSRQRIMAGRLLHQSMRVDC
jgi:hypothetical protein